MYLRLSSVLCVKSFMKWLDTVYVAKSSLPVTSNPSRAGISAFTFYISTKGSVNPGLVNSGINKRPRKSKNVSAKRKRWFEGNVLRELTQTRWYAVGSFFACAGLWFPDIGESIEVSFSFHAPTNIN